MTSATGTEYVNAQAGELRLKIDELASKIHSQGASAAGLVFTTNIIGEFAFAHIHINYYPDQHPPANLWFGLGQWNGSVSSEGKTAENYGTFSRTISRLIPKEFCPKTKLTSSGSHTGGGDYSIEVFTDGSVRFAITGSGGIIRIFDYEW
ncbi:MAG: hypothetical protein IJI87_07465 [Mogibacterium sp.]|nr:hypothetical protein [Mogibacterium sp.]